MATIWPLHRLFLCFAVYHRQHGLYLLDEADRLSALDGRGLMVRPLADLVTILDNMSDAQLMIDPASLPHTLSALVAASGVQAVRKACPVTTMKACKNDSELAGFRAAHQRDGVALVEFMAWFGSSAVTGLTESLVADKLEWFRAARFCRSPALRRSPDPARTGRLCIIGPCRGPIRRLGKNDVLLDQVPITATAPPISPAQSRLACRQPMLLLPIQRC